MVDGALADADYLEVIMRNSLDSSDDEDESKGSSFFTDFIVHHDGPFYLSWWTLIALLSLISAIVTPLAMAFLEDREGDNLEISFDVLFYIDIIMTFFVSLETHGLRITEHRVLARKYLTTYFAVDILSIFPFERVVDGPYLSLLQLFRLLRLRRFFPLLQPWKKSRLFNYFVVSFLKYVMMMTFNTHWAACIFYEFARQEGFGENTWVGASAIGLENESLGTRYTTSLYFAVTTFTTVGYADFAPQNVQERAWAVLYMMTNLGITSYLIGQITFLVSRPDSKVGQWREHLDDIAKFLRRSQVPKGLQRKVLGFLQLQESLKFARGQEAMDVLPAAVRMKIRCARFHDMINSIDIFHGVSANFGENLLAYVKEELFMAGMKIIQRGDYGCAFYILVKGECEILTPGDASKRHSRDESKEESCAIIRPGGHFGSEGFFAGGHQPFTIRVRESSIILKIEEGFKRELENVFALDGLHVVSNIVQRLRCLRDSIAACVSILILYFPQSTMASEFNSVDAFPKTEKNWEKVW